MKDLNFDSILNSILGYVGNSSESNKIKEIINNQFEYPIAKARFEDSPEHKRNRRLHRALQEFITTERTFRAEISNILILCIYKQKKLSKYFSANTYCYLTNFIIDLLALTISITELSPNLESKILQIKVTEGQPIQNELTKTEIQDVLNALDQAMDPQNGSFKKKFLHFANLISKKNELEIRIPQIFSDEPDYILKTLLQYQGTDSLSFYLTNRIILPIQRAPRYKLMLTELFQHLPEDQLRPASLISNAQQYCSDLNTMLSNPSSSSKDKDGILSAITGQFAFFEPVPPHKLLESNFLGVSSFELPGLSL